MITISKQYEGISPVLPILLWIKNMPLTTKALIDNLGKDLHAVDAFGNNALSIAHHNHDDSSEQLLRNSIL
jgi:hypothetical protein